VLSEAEMGSPMPIQAQALPLAMAGYDVMGVAKAGSGKTLAHLIPAIVHVEAQDRLAQGEPTPIALVLAPTREDVAKIATEGQRVLESSDLGNHPGGVGCVALFGGTGQNKNSHISALREGCHIVAATPERILELVESHAISLSRVTFLVVAEADRILEQGLGEQVCSIAAQVRSDRHTLLTAATLSPAVRDLVGTVCQDRSKVITVTVGQPAVDGGAAVLPDVAHEVVVFDQPSWEERDKLKSDLTLAHLREVLSVSLHKCLVFVSRKALADKICSVMWDQGFHTQALYGGKNPAARADILDRFKNNDLRLLVTTDDVSDAFRLPDISHVVVYDVVETHDYIDRSAVASRGSYGQGHTLAFYEFDRKWSPVPGELVEVLRRSGQDVSPQLAQLAEMGPDQVGAASAVRAAKYGRG